MFNWRDHVGRTIEDFESTDRALVIPERPEDYLEEPGFVQSIVDGYAGRVVWLSGKVARGSICSIEGGYWYKPSWLIPFWGRPTPGAAVVPGDLIALRVPEGQPNDGMPLHRRVVVVDEGPDETGYCRATPIGSVQFVFDPGVYSVERVEFVVDRTKQVLAALGVPPALLRPEPAPVRKIIPFKHKLSRAQSMLIRHAPGTDPRQW